MTKFTDNLWSDLVREHGPSLAGADRPEPGRAGGAQVGRHPRILAGSTLGLAGVGAALVLALGGSAAPPAFAITKASDGSVLVHLNYVKNLNLGQLERKLADMGTNEQVTIYMSTGAATVDGPVTCAPATGASSPPGPAVKVLVGNNGTEVIAPGQSGGNTAEGSFHLDHCVVSTATDSGNTGAG
jgi:hypothetical protein